MAQQLEVILFVEFEVFTKASANQQHRGEINYQVLNKDSSSRNRAQQFRLSPVPEVKIPFIFTVGVYKSVNLYSVSLDCSNKRISHNQMQMTKTCKILS